MFFLYTPKFLLFIYFYYFLFECTSVVLSKYLEAHVCQRSKSGLDVKQKQEEKNPN